MWREVGRISKIERSAGKEERGHQQHQSDIQLALTWKRGGTGKEMRGRGRGGTRAGCQLYGTDGESLRGLSTMKDCCEFSSTTSQFHPSQNTKYIFF